MEFLSRMKSWLKNQVVYMTAREVLAMAVLPVVFSMLEGSGVTDITAFGMALAATIPLQLYIGTRKRHATEDRLVTRYNNEISAKLGVPIHELTREHLHLVSDGDPERGIPGNPLLAQARNRPASRQFIFQLSLVAATVVTVGLYSLFSDAHIVQTNIIDPLKSFMDKHLFGADARVLTATIFSGTLLSTVSFGISEAIESLFGLGHKTAHERIQDIRQDMNRNHQITQEQVFGVFVAADQGLDTMIEAIYKKPYHKLSAHAQQQVMNVYGFQLQNPALTKHTIAALTDDLNNRQIEADELAFAVVGQESGVPRLPVPRPIGVEKTKLEEIADGVALGLLGHKKSKTEEERDRLREQEQKKHSSETGAANDNVPGFAERFVPRENKPPQTYVEREKQRDAERTAINSITP